MEILMPRGHIMLNENDNPFEVIIVDWDTTADDIWWLFGSDAIGIEVTHDAGYAHVTAKIPQVSDFVQYGNAYSLFGNLGEIPKSFVFKPLQETKEELPHVLDEFE